MGSRVEASECLSTLGGSLGSSSICRFTCIAQIWKRYIPFFFRTMNEHFCMRSMQPRIRLDELSPLVFIYPLEWISLVGGMHHPSKPCNQTPARCNGVAQRCCQSFTTPSNSMRKCTLYSIAYPRGLPSPSVIICCLSATLVLSPGSFLYVVHHGRISGSGCCTKDLVLVLCGQLRFLSSQDCHLVYFHLTREQASLSVNYIHSRHAPWLHWCLYKGWTLLSLGMRERVAFDYIPDQCYC